MTEQEQKAQVLFAAMDRRDELKEQKFLTDKEKLELRNLEVKVLQLYSDWKDDF